MKLISLLLSVVLCSFSAVSLASAQSAGGSAHTLIVKSDGTVWAFGDNASGQLGDNTTIDKRTPFQISGLGSVVAVAAGSAHSMALTSGGTVYVWGENGNAQVGNNSTVDRKNPLALSLSSVTAIAAGEFHSLALLSNGDVYGWGKNLNGQLTGTSTANITTPQLIASGVTAIAAGWSHSIIIKTDGTAWATGLNSSGQLGIGNNSPTQQTAFVQMTGISGAVAATAGSKHTVVLLSDGTLKATGANTRGQVGDNNQQGTMRTSAVAVTGLTNVTAIEAGFDHTLARRSDGSLWAWGENSDGQLGDAGATAFQRAPAQVPGLSSIASFAAGFRYSVATTSAGVVYTWGQNSAGELGDGTGSSTTPNRVSPDTISGADYAWKMGTPIFSPAPATFTTAPTVTMTDDTLSAHIYYTTNGVDPTELDNEYASGITLTVSQTFKARAFKAGMPPSSVAVGAYELKVVTPTVSPAAGQYTSERSVTATTTTSGAVIRYALATGSQVPADPTESATLYTGAIAVNTKTTIKFAAFKTGWTPSTVVSKTYTFNYGTLASPTVDPATGQYAGSVTVTMSSPQNGAVVRYTTTGATPVSTSPIYTAPIVYRKTTTIKAKVFHDDYLTSPDPPTTRVYTIAATTPTLSTASGTYAPGSVVTISTTDSDLDTLRMTIDGTDPTSTSAVAASGTTMFLGNFTLKVRAFRNVSADAVDSNVATATYLLNAPMGPGSATAGDQHTAIATPDGRVFAWGENGSGQVGDGSSTDRTTPTLVQTVTGVTAITTGGAFTLARTWDGQVYSWGLNGSGRLGLGGTTPSFVNRPGLIPTLANVVALAAGDAHGLALTSDGRVFSWGENGSGQLGLGSTTDTYVPTEITSLSNIIAIAAGDAHSLAVTSSGQVYAWGADGSSRLGDGQTNNKLSPVAIALTDAVAVGAGASHSIALTRSGAVYTWGLHNSGQLGTGATAIVSTPALVSGLQGSAIAAGDNFSAVLRTDGVLVAFGADASGQIGDTGINPTELLPKVVSGPSSVSTIALGDAHAIAVSPSGDVWTWGESASGRLGDGQITTDKATPQIVLSGIANWAPAAPTIDTPSTVFTDPHVVTVTSPTSGAEIRYTTNGADPTESDALAPTNGQVEIAFSSLFRARVFASERAPGAIARADYQLTSPVPTISPGTGSYSSAQTVSMSASGPAATIRYTLDGSDPTPSSTEYTAPLVVATSLTVKARAYPTNGWIPSAVSSATFTLNYGVLNAPVASPVGGYFPAAQIVALMSDPGTSIRYTIDGSTPTGSSALYSSPISVNSGMVIVKAIAVKPDWTASVAMSESYTIDTVPPINDVGVFPSPINGWNNGPLKVTFHCSDNVLLQSCTDSVDVTPETAGQIVTGSAIDMAGHETARSVTVRVDMTAPTVTIASPTEDLVTTDTSVDVVAAVSDALSGVFVVTCNGVEATVDNGSVACTVALNKGVNTVVVHAQDLAGNTMSKSIRVTQVGTATQLVLAPAKRTMLISEIESLSLTDDFGASVVQANWTASDPLIVELSGDDPPTIKALAAGTATIVATKDGLSAETAITVLSDAVMPNGSQRWEVSNVGSGPLLYTNRTGLDDPAIFAQGYNGTNNFVTALSADGRSIATFDSPGGEAPGFFMMGDSFGALVKPTFRADHPWSPWGDGLLRFAGPSTQPAWRYESTGFLAYYPAQAPDGTIYVAEKVQGTTATGAQIWDLSIVSLDGETGEVLARVPLPRNVEVYEDNRAQVGATSCGTTPLEYEGGIYNVVVGDDGRAYVTRRDQTNVARFNGQGCAKTFVSRETKIMLMVLDAHGLVSTQSLTTNALTTCGDLPIPWRLLPDLRGGVIASTVNQNICTSAIAPDRIIRVDASGTTITFPNTDALDVEMVSEPGNVFLKPFQGSGSITAKDLDSWSTIWTTSVSSRLVHALENGGVVLEDGTVINSDGTIASTVTLDLDGASAVVQSDRFIGTHYDGVSGVNSVASTASIVPSKSRLSFLFNEAGRGNPSNQAVPFIGCFVAPSYAATVGLQRFRGFAPGFEANYAFNFDFEPPYVETKWNPEKMAGVVHGFELWNQANAVVPTLSPSDPARETRFVPYEPPPEVEPPPPPHIQLFNKFIPVDPQNPQIRVAFFTANGPGGPTWDGYIDVNTWTTEIWFNTDPTLLNTGEGFLRNALHEIGHSLGIWEGYTKVNNKAIPAPAATVMNANGGVDDRAGFISNKVTACDQLAAAKYGRRPLP